MPKVANCPYCRQDYTAGEAKCPHCHSEFPWAIEDEKIREEIKSRETNRVRATATLMQEVTRAANGGPAVSMAAITGFASAWLFPRIVIAIGSIFGAVILLAQTFILWNQTTLLSSQTEAAKIEQSTKLRERIAANSTKLDQLERLLEIYSGSENPQACEDPACGNSLVDVTLAGLRQDDPAIPAEHIRNAWIEASSKLYQVASEVNRLVSSPELDLDRRRSNLLVVDEIVRPATIQCLHPPKISARLIEKLSGYSLLTANAMWVDQPLRNKEDYLKFGEQFPQTISNTNMGLMEYSGAIDSISTAGTGNRKSKDSNRDYKFNDLIGDINKTKAEITSGMTELVSSCADLIDEDSELLSAMKPQKILDPKINGK